MAAELRLGVSFDLVYFRQQLDKLARITASEFTAPIKIRLDRQVVDRELSNLQRAFNRRNYRINVNDASVIAARDNISSLTANLATLRRSLSDPIVVNVQYKKTGDIPGRGTSAVNRGVREAVGSQSIVDRASRKDLQDLYKFARAAEIPFEELKNQAKSKTEELRRVLGPAFANIGEDIKAGIAAGLADANSELAKVASSMADTLLTTLKTQLGIASPSKETAKLGKFAGQGFANGFVSSMVQAERQMARAIRSSVLGAIREGLGNLPGLGGALVSFERQLAAGIQVAVRKAMREGLKAAIMPGMQGGALGAAGGAATGAAVGGGKALSGALVGGLAKLGAGGAFGIASQMGRLTVGDTTGLTTFVQETVAQVIHAALSTGGQGALVGAAAVGGVAGAAGFTSGTLGSLVTQVATAVRNRVLAALLTVSTGQVNSIVQVMVRDVTNTLFQGIQRRIRAAMAQLPVIDWPAVAPSRNIAIGPGSTGRALPGAPTPGALPGTSAFNQKLLLGDLLDPALKVILSDAANAFVDQFRAEMNAAVRGVNIRDLGTTIRGALPPGAPPPSRPMLPAAGGSGGYFSGGRRPGGGFVPPGGFPSDGMLGGPGGPKSMLSLDYYRNAFKYAEALKVAQANMAKFSASQIPLLSGLKNVAGEFGMATQQVLLYGTAYRGLAFISSLPGQLLNAARGQQQYNNALQVATQASGTYAKELLLVDNIQRAFGLNLQTTRDGFVRLYASMSPAGFDSGSIERLFTGISAATAALQLTPDKAERVIYAFGQMASKGQVMSEELKGQLGDVLPGALSIFSAAAGKSIQEFNKNLEDGVYKGQAFRDLMTKVTDELINRFGTGAQAAGRSLQGLLNTVQGDFQRTLESFTPLADSAAQAILIPLGQALRQLSASAQIAMGEMDRLQAQITGAKQIVVDLKIGGAKPEQIKAAEQNVAALEARYEMLNQRLKDPAVAQQVKDIQRLTEEFGKAGKFVLDLAQAIGRVLGPAFSFLGQNMTGIIGTIVPLVAGFAAARLAAMGLMAALTAIRGVMAAIGFVRMALQLGSLTAAMTQAGVSSRVLSALFGMLGVSANSASIGIIGVRTAMMALLASTGIGLLVVGLTSLAAAFISVGNSAQKAAEKSKQAMASMKDAIASGNVDMLKMDLAVAQADANDLERAVRSIQSIEGGRQNTRGGRSVRTLSAQQIPASARRILQRQGIDIPTGEFAESALMDRINAVRNATKGTISEYRQSIPEAEARRRLIGLSVPTPGPATPGTPSSADTKSQNAALQMADDRRKYEADLMKLNNEQAMKLDQMAFDHWKSLQDTKFDYIEAGQNEWMKRETKFQRDLQAIEIRRIEAIRKAQQETQQAMVEAQGKAYVAGGGATGLPAGITGYITGDPSSPFYQADHGGSNYHEHLKFATRAAAEEAYQKLVSSGVKVTEFKGYSPVGRHTPGSAHYSGLAFDVPAAQVPVGQEKQLTARVQSILGFPGAAPSSRARTEAKQDYSAELAGREAINAKERESVAIKQANYLAQQEINTLVAQYVASIAPVEQQRLENSLLQDRVALIKQGYSGDQLNMQIKVNEMRRQGALAIEESNKKIEENNQAVKDGTLGAEEAARMNDVQKKKIEELTKAMEEYLPLLREKTTLERQSKFEEELSGLQRQAGIVGQGLRAGFVGEARQKYESAIADGYSPEEASKLAEATRQLELATMVANNLENAANGIGDAFAQSFSEVLTGSMTAQAALAQFFSNVAKMFADMAAQMIAKWLVMKAIGLVGSLLGGGIGSFAGGAGIGQAVEMPSSVGIGAGGGIIQNSMGQGFGTFGPNFGIRQFATGGIVTGPTLGLVGEGRFNEAVVPLPDGKSIPVQLGEGAGNNISTNIVVNVNNGQASSQVNGGGGQALGRELEGAVRSVILKETRPGGIIYNQR